MFKLAGLSVASVWVLQYCLGLPGLVMALGKAITFLSFPPHHTAKASINTDAEMNACHYIYMYTPKK